MPTQRPFLSTFLAAFRAHSQPHPNAQPSVSAQTQTIWTSATSTNPKATSGSSENLASPRPINPKATHAYTTAVAAVAASQEKQLHPALQHNVSPQTHLPRSTPSPGSPVYGPQNKPQPSYPTSAESRRTRTRRGSDSSCDSGGFREVKGGGEKWFVGGRTASGEEKYYKLSMVKRDRSSDRISADQLSL